MVPLCPFGVGGVLIFLLTLSLVTIQFQLGLLSIPTTPILCTCH